VLASDREPTTLQVHLKVMWLFGESIGTEMLEPPTAMVPVGEGRQRHVTLELTIFNGAHMPKCDFVGTCDPFCRVAWKEQVFETQVVSRTYTPEWNEAFTFQPHTVRPAATTPHQDSGSEASQGGGVSGVVVAHEEHDEGTRHRGHPPGAQDAPPPLRVQVLDYDTMSACELLGETELPADLMAQLVLAPNGWTAACSLHLTNRDGGLQLKGQDKQPTEVAIGVRVAWTEEEDSVGAVNARAAPTDTDIVIAQESSSPEKNRATREGMKKIWVQEVVEGCVMDVEKWVPDPHSPAAVTDEKGKTCLSIAMDHTHDAAAELLVQPTIGAGVDIDAQDKEGKTVLMRACADGLTNTAAKLMKLNANLGIKDKHDSTALELTKDTVTFKCLREGGAQIPDITEEVLVSVCLCAS